MQGRDVQLIKAFLKDRDRETSKKISKYLSKLKKNEIENIADIKEFVRKNRMELKTVGEKQKMHSSCENGYCANIVCNFVACVSNSDCKNGACSQNGCSAAAGCYIGRISGCSAQPTCGVSACHSNAGGDCGNESCSSLVS